MKKRISKFLVKNNVAQSLVQRQLGGFIFGVFAGLALCCSVGAHEIGYDEVAAPIADCEVRRQQAGASAAAGAMAVDLCMATYFETRRFLGAGQTEISPHDIRLAFELREKWAKRGEGIAQFLLATAYFEGSQGVAQSDYHAHVWGLMALANGSVEALGFASHDFARQFLTTAQRARAQAEAERCMRGGYQECDGLLSRAASTTKP